jgi:hypothetical protein
LEKAALHLGHELPHKVTPRRTLKMFPFQIVKPLMYKPKPRLFFVGQAGTFSSGSSTLTGVNFGPAGMKRVWYAITWNNDNNRTLNTITIGGVAATRAVRAVDSSAISNTEIWYADLEAASGNIVMQWSGSIFGGRSAVYYSDTDITTMTPAVFSDTNSGTAFSTTVATKNYGFLIAVARWQNLSTGRTYTWTGANSVLGDNNGAFGENFAMVNLTDRQDARAVGGSLSSNSSYRRLAVLAVK